MVMKEVLSDNDNLEAMITPALVYLYFFPKIFCKCFQGNACYYSYFYSVILEIL